MYFVVELEKFIASARNRATHPTQNRNGQIKWVRRVIRVNTSGLRWLRMTRFIFLFVAQRNVQPTNHIYIKVIKIGQVQPVELRTGPMSGSVDHKNHVCKNLGQQTGKPVESWKKKLENRQFRRFWRYGRFFFFQ